MSKKVQVFNGTKSAAKEGMMMEKIDALKVEVYIDKQYQNLRTALQEGQNKFFDHGYELLAFAASIGWENGIRHETPSAGYSIPIHRGNNKNGASVLADMIGLLEAEKQSAKIKDSDPSRSLRAMSESTFTERCRILSGYAACGFSYIEKKRDQDGGSYEEVVLAIFDELEVDKSLLSPMAGITK